MDHLNGHTCPKCGSEIMTLPSGLKGCSDCNWSGFALEYYKAWAEKLASRPCACQVHSRGYWFVIGLILGVIIYKSLI